MLNAIHALHPIRPLLCVHPSEDRLGIKKLLRNDENATYAAVFARKTGRLPWVAGKDQQEKEQRGLYDTRSRQGGRKEGGRRGGGTGEHGDREGGILRWLRQGRGEVRETGVEERVRDLEGREEARGERRGVG